jgi:hypothetical protein
MLTWQDVVVIGSTIIFSWYIYIYIYIYISFLYIYFIFNLNIFFIYALTPTPILIYLQFMHWQLGPCSKYFLAPSLILPIIFYYYEPFAYDVGDVFYTISVSPKLNHIKFLFYVYFYYFALFNLMCNYIFPKWTTGHYQYVSCVVYKLSKFNYVRCMMSCGLDWMGIHCNSLYHCPTQL